MVDKTPRKLITLVVGARPNFMKIAPIIRAIKDKGKGSSYRLVHTGQHKDAEMNEVFFQDLDIPEPDAFLESKGDTHAKQTASIMVEFEKDCIENNPDLVLVVGDVNSTLSCAIVAKKLHIQLAHVEAGLRSNDREMPEEINRVLVDSISDLWFTTEPSGVENLLKEGHEEKDIHYVGNVMVDNLFYQNKQLDRMSACDFPHIALKNKLKEYAILTLHRPSNVDNKEVLEGILRAVNKISLELPVIFPMHPRTAKSVRKFNIKFNSNVYITPPMAYQEFLRFWRDSKIVLTDSGGLQEETTALGIKCITIRNNTERPITVLKGTNTLSGVESENIEAAFEKITKSEEIVPTTIEFWDGLASERIVSIVDKYLSSYDVF